MGPVPIWLINIRNKSEPCLQLEHWIHTVFSVSSSFGIPLQLDSLCSATMTSQKKLQYSGAWPLLQFPVGCLQDSSLNLIILGKVENHYFTLFMVKFHLFTIIPLLDTIEIVLRVDVFWRKITIPNDNVWCNMVLEFVWRGSTGDHVDDFQEAHVIHELETVFAGYTPATIIWLGGVLLLAQIASLT